jgi:small subunit ribosomal protein S16
MPVKIRLSRQGRKRSPYYHIVVADSRAPRDGRYIERLGSYNPNTNPATIELNFDKALQWLQTGAQPTDTCRGILSNEGVLMKHHLLNGVKKNAFSLEVADQKFETWKKDKIAKIEAKKDGLAQGESKELAARLDAEAKVNEERAAALAKKQADAAAAKAKANAKAVVVEEVEVAEEIAAAPEVAAVAPEQAVETPKETVEAPEATTEAGEEAGEVKE